MLRKWILTGSAVVMLGGLALVAGFGSSTDVATLPIDSSLSQTSSSALSQTTTSNHVVDPWTPFDLSQQEFSQAKLQIAYSPSASSVTGVLNYPGGSFSYTETDHWATTLQTQFGTMDYVLTQGTFSNGVTSLNVNIDAQFVPGTSDAQAVMTVDGAGVPLHLVWGTPFVDEAILQQMNQALHSGQS